MAANVIFFFLVFTWENILESIWQKEDVAFDLVAYHLHELEDVLNDQLKLGFLRETLKFKKVLFECAGEWFENQGGRLFDVFRESFKHGCTWCAEAFMVTAESVLIPGVRITAVTATTNICFEPHFMASVVPFWEALLANDAGAVFLAILTFPSYVASLQWLSTYSHCCSCLV